MGIALTFVDFLRPEDLGLTSPRWAEALVPSAKTRKPSFLIFMAALISLSCCFLQCGQSTNLTPNESYPLCNIGIGSKV